MEAVLTRRPRTEHLGPAIRTDAVYVAFTTVEEALAALRTANQFSNAMGVPIVLVHVRGVPYPLATNHPTGLSPIETGTFIEQLRAEGLHVRPRVVLCRDEQRTLALAFTPHSLIVIGGRRHWWLSRSERYQRQLEAAGHFVVFVDTTEHKELSHA